MLRIFKRGIKTDITEVKKGNILKINGKLSLITDKSKGGKARQGAHYKLELKDIASGIKSSERFNAGSSVDGIFIITKWLKWCIKPTTFYMLEKIL